MNIIQSFWTKPVSNISDKRTGGWLNKKYHYISWAFSCLQLLKYYDNVHLWTDDFGKEILIDKLNLPYTKVSTGLNALKRYDPSVWVVGKLYTYKQQEEAFIHVDSDVYIFEKFSEKLEKSSLIAQSTETTSASYYRDIREVIDNLECNNEVLNCYQNSDLPLPCYNAGLLGGNDIAFLQEYATQAFKVIDQSMSKFLNTEMIKVFNVLAEQYVYFGMIQQRRQNIEFFIEKAKEQHFWTASIRELVRDLKYTHFMGGWMGGYKQSMVNCQILENWLKINYPRYYYQIERLLGNNEI